MPVNRTFDAYLSSRVHHMPANEIVTVADLARYDESVIRLWIGEGDLATPDFIKQAAWRALAAGETRYSYSQGLPALRTALAAYHHRHWGIEIEPARFCATVGGMNAVVMALQAILEEGDEVIMPSPAWPNAEQAIAIAGGVCVPAAFDFHGDGAITLNLEALFAAVTARTKAIFINSPHNPTGWIMPKADMVRLRDFARERGLWIVADEVYNHFVYDDDKTGPAPSFLQLCTPEDRLLVTNTFSKNWCMTGWRAGWLVFPEGLDALFASLCQYNTTGVATFIQRACIAALDGGDAFISEQVERCRASRDILLAGLSALANVTVFAPRGTFYLFFRIEGMNGNSLAMVRDILRQARVGLAPGAAFGRRGDNYLRLCFAIDPELAHAALERLVPFLRQLGSDTATRERTAKFPESVTK